MVSVIFHRSCWFDKPFQWVHVSLDMEVNQLLNRRFISAALAGCLLVGAPMGSAWAAEQTAPAVPAVPQTAPPGEVPPGPPPEPKITSAQAEAALRELFTLPQKTEKVDLQWQLNRYGQKATWELQVTVREGNGATSFALATVDGITGRVQRYGAFGMLPALVRTGPLSPVRSVAEAREKAWALVQKVAPEKAAVLKEPADGSQPMGYYPYWYGSGPADYYQFTWVEHHDGVPFPASSVSVSVHKSTLEYINLQVNLMESITFQAGPAKVSADEALKRWRAEAKPSLSYQPVMSPFPVGPSKATGYKLVYSFGDVGRAIDAMTGEWAKDPSPFLPPEQPQSQPAEPEPVPVGNVVPITPAQLPLDEAAAQRLARAILEVAPEGQLRTEISPFDEERLYQFTLMDRTQYANIQIEPKTGLIRMAHRSPMMAPDAPPQDKPEEQKITPELEQAAKSAAFATVQTYYSQLRDQLRLDAPPAYWGPEDNQVRRFRFVRYVNGLPLQNDSVSVTIDLATMKWREMSASWTSGITFPDPSVAISAEKALEAALADRKPVLTYRPVFPQVSLEESRMGRMPQPTEAALVYVLGPEFATQVDGLTGKRVSYDGLEVQDLQAAYDRVTGHWAEGELQFMLARRAVRPNELNPAAPLTRGQAAGLMFFRSPNLHRSGPRPVDLPFTDLPETNPAYGAVRMGWVDGWLRPQDNETQFRPEAPVTRAEFVVWVARTLGLGDLARSNLDTRSEFTDLDGLTLEQRNAANFLRALGLLSPADTFRGAEPLTQAEGAAITVRAYNYALKQL